ncbi:hypothetical protein TYRP_023760 [Tyrophagus putrescentiae]|nr:hypothetical protein TYRP_023760 [Tyrophagus putrescentiae]
MIEEEEEEESVPLKNRRFRHRQKRHGSESRGICAPKAYLTPPYWQPNKYPSVKTGNQQVTSALITRT